MLLKKIDLRVDLRLLVLGEGMPPTFELIGVFDIPRQHGIIPREEYSVEGIVRQG